MGSVFMYRFQCTDTVPMCVYIPEAWKYTLSYTHVHITYTRTLASTRNCIYKEVRSSGRLSANIIACACLHLPCRALTCTYHNICRQSTTAPHLLLLSVSSCTCLLMAAICSATRLSSLLLLLPSSLSPSFTSLSTSCHASFSRCRRFSDFCLASSLV